MIGCEEHLAGRAVTAELGDELRASVAKAEHYSVAMGWPSFATGNASGGLTTNRGEIPRCVQAKRRAPAGSRPA